MAEHAEQMRFGAKARGQAVSIELELSPSQVQANYQKNR